MLCYNDTNAVCPSRLIQVIHLGEDAEQFHIEKHQNLNSRQDLCFSRAFANHRMFRDAILHSEVLRCQV